MPQARDLGVPEVGRTGSAASQWSPPSDAGHAYDEEGARERTG
ncbi:MAG TPA: hypothetical protein VFX52_05710 [Nocardioidaceae bacterium]|nr:hypothetical protein [Nocardioidaceae bacterium]